MILFLTPGRYVGSEKIKDDGEPFHDKMIRLKQEYVKCLKESKYYDEEIHKNLREIWN